MKKTMYTIFSALLAAAVSSQSYAETNLHDLTNGDAYYFNSDVDIKADDGQTASLGAGRPSTTHSSVPHLPVYNGYMSTNSTYRYINIGEQVMTMIGEGKHGLWRVGEDGTVREYLIKGHKGLKPGADLNSKKNLHAIEHDYSSHIVDENNPMNWDGYKYPDQKLSEAGTLNYINLPISHPKYKGKYEGHVPIDLASYNCTMSGPTFPYSAEAMNFAFDQPAEGHVGPLGVRAGLDIKENYQKIIQLDHFPDARAWANVGVAGHGDDHFEYQAIDTNKTKAEYYIVERTFFNVPYLFIIAVFENADDHDFSYMRPDGAYWDSLSKEQQKAAHTEVVVEHSFHLEKGGKADAKNIPLYGLHHPKKDAYGGGGACPSKGGDYGRYPNADTGAMWPTNYEEVNPLCDGVVVDIKFYANLDHAKWSDPHKYLANAGVGTKTITYENQAGTYGVYTDPYNVKRGVKNPHLLKAKKRVTITYPHVQKAVTPNE